MDIRRFKMTSVSLAICVTLLMSSHALADGYQININAGTDNPEKTATRNTAASFGQAQFSTFTRLFRFQSGFTVLSGTSYLEGEASFGMAIYLLSPFVDIKSPVHPFLLTAGSIGFGSFQEKQRMDGGYGIGAGVDLQLFYRSGLTLSIQQHKATEATLRYVLGFYWYKGSF